MTEKQTFLKIFLRVYRKCHAHFDPKDKKQGLFAKVLERIVVTPGVCYITKLLYLKETLK